LPVGDVSILLVPRAVAEKAGKSPNPAWLGDGVPGIVRVAGAIHTNPIEKHSAEHRYELKPTADGLEAVLLNPEVLLPYAAVAPIPQRTPTPAYLWVALAAGAVLLAAALMWCLTRLVKAPS
jgi:hypothetical protein